VERAALVTGASNGIGLEFAKLLAGDGYDLILVDINGNGLETARAEIEKKWQVGVKLIKIDFSQSEAACEVYGRIKDIDIDVLINNAGHGHWGPFSESDWKWERSMIFLHVVNSSHLTKLILKGMISRGRGKIMNVSSVAALVPGPMMAVYYASKSYLLSFGQAISNELKGTGITVTSLCPGLIRTGFAISVAKNSNVPKMKEGFLSDSSEKIAAKAYKAMNKGKQVYIPMFKNRIYAFLLWILPRRIATIILRKMQDRIH